MRFCTTFYFAIFTFINTSEFEQCFWRGHRSSWFYLRSGSDRGQHGQPPAAASSLANLAVLRLAGTTYFEINPANKVLCFQPIHAFPAPRVSPWPGGAKQHVMHLPTDNSFNKIYGVNISGREDLYTTITIRDPRPRPYIAHRDCRPNGQPVLLYLRAHRHKGLLARRFAFPTSRRWHLIHGRTQASHLRVTYTSPRCRVDVPDLEVLAMDHARCLIQQQKIQNGNKCFASAMCF